MLMVMLPDIGLDLLDEAALLTLLTLDEVALNSFEPMRDEAIELLEGFELGEYANIGNELFRLIGGSCKGLGKLPDGMDQLPEKVSSVR